MEYHITVLQDYQNSGSNAGKTRVSSRNPKTSKGGTNVAISGAPNGTGLSRTANNSEYKSALR